ncbi:MAG: AAA family ATPase [Chitinophagaceae bacterium]|nr:AAA family ATPase [Chitinophagaceae bacterium]
MKNSAPGAPIELNSEFQQALERMENSDESIFLTGKAGTGKSTLIDYFRSNTKKKMVVLAPTGVAALNVGGQTIHSFFRFGHHISPEKVRKQSTSLFNYSKIDTIVIDEISMVRADLLDSVSRFMQLNGSNKNLPFGGAQLIMVGDPFQLPPVVSEEEWQLFNSKYNSPFFFDALIFRQEKFKTLHLKKIYRQQDADFISILNGIRDNNIDQHLLNVLNEQLDNEAAHHIPNFYIFLTGRNRSAAEINLRSLNKLPGITKNYSATLTGDFDEKYFPADKLLLLKEGAQVMFQKNDPKGRWVNGTVGTVTKMENDKVTVLMESGSTEEVETAVWQILRYKYNLEKNRVDTEEAGTFTQFPIKLAWAITVHKSQSKTFEKVIIDTRSGFFAPGQLYVALSRCKSLEGIKLTAPVTYKDIMIDEYLMSFFS